MVALKIEVMLPQAKQCQETPEAEKNKGQVLPSASGRSMALKTPISPF